MMHNLVLDIGMELGVRPQYIEARLKLFRINIPYIFILIILLFYFIYSYFKQHVKSLRMVPGGSVVWIIETKVVVFISLYI